MRIKNLTLFQGALNLSKEKKNAANVQRTIVLLRYRIQFFRAASKQPLKPYLLKTAS